MKAGRAKRTREEWVKVMNTSGSGHWANETDRGMDYDIAWREILSWRDLGLWKEGDYIVDIGAGNGRLAIPFTEFDVRYLGVEPMRACVEYCKRAFQEWPHIQFEHVDLQNDMYNPLGVIRPESFRFPLSDGEADVLIFGSIYTHLATLETASWYIRETWRSLKPGGRAVLSWFRSPPNTVSYEARRTVYREADILNLTRSFEFLDTGGGLSDGFHDQWCMIVKKPDDAHVAARES